MARKKVKLAFIANDSSRKTTFRKRKMGLMKKMNELSTLCGIRACAIINSPYDTTPEVWPSNAGAQRIINEFRMLPEVDQHKKMVDQETFLRQRIAKANENLIRQRKDNRELVMTEVMFQCLTGRMDSFDFNIRDFDDLGYLIDQFLKKVKYRLEIMQTSGMEIGQSSNAVPTEVESVVEAEVDAQGGRTITVVASTTVPTTMVSEAVPTSSSAKDVAFLNSMQQHQYQPLPQLQLHPQPQQQQFCYPLAPHVGFYEHPQNLNEIQQMSYVDEQMSFTHLDDNHPHHLYHHQRIPVASFTAPTAVSNSIISESTNRNSHYQPQPQQEIASDSPTEPASDSSNNIVPATDPYLTNNI